MASHASEVIRSLSGIGITYDDARELRRISMQLHSWHERECGTEYGCVTENDDGTAYYTSANSGREYPVPNRGAGARRRLKALMARYPTLSAYIQGDPRGAALYILRPGDVPYGEDVDAYYSRGIAVYK